MKLLKVEDRKVYNSVRGLICIGSRFEVEIYNPSTSQQYIFPQISIAGLFCKSTVYYFGYDPVEDQYKVLAINDMRMQLYHSVVVLGRDGVWREVPWFGYLHHAQTSGLCINGTLYYGAIRTYNKFSIVVSFDVRLETFNIIKGPVFEKLNNEFKSDFTDKTLINFWGKIAVVEKPRRGSFRMWVLKDAKKEEWFMNIYRLPESAACLDLDVMTYFYAGEICLVSKKLSDPFCLFF
ncbi:putative F-box protein At3g47150 [Arabidopsis lyrata subsp. lyrata]|uniref:putative F-box protein At3g47150 n=1 Tax=Arabidopsis lyrata subsp. lyrata TaxID=81972 RepID=UPI000A29C092|nr:putative F-box protein At3g47150 [Arabidopsis lyrata subsp. lyrata]|eukprot:XP_020884350.1 putative F-box protein At3g47150 [Arabidopsis lyrata subsp. lyrata]